MICHLDKLFNLVPTKIIYCYKEYQKELHEFLKVVPNVELVRGFPSNLYILAKDMITLWLCSDDMMEHCSGDQLQRVADLLTHGS